LNISVRGNVRRPFLFRESVGLCEQTPYSERMSGAAVFNARLGCDDRWRSRKYQVKTSPSSGTGRPMKTLV